MCLHPPPAGTCWPVGVALRYGPVHHVHHADQHAVNSAGSHKLILKVLMAVDSTGDGARTRVCIRAGQLQMIS